MATEVLLTYLDSTKWMWTFFSQHETLRNNTTAKVEILTSFIELILRKNAERYKRHEAYMSFDEINTYPTPVIARYKGKHAFNTPQKRERTNSTPTRTPTPNKRFNSRSASASSEPKDPRFNPEGPKGKQFLSLPKSIASLGKRLCIKWNTAGSQPDGSACTNRHTTQGCVSKDNRTFIHKCRKKYDAHGEDGSYCNLNHPEFKHTG